LTKNPWNEARNPPGAMVAATIWPRGGIRRMLGIFAAPVTNGAPGSPNEEEAMNLRICHLGAFYRRMTDRKGASGWSRPRW
jgi:hypothetical protein